MSRIIIYVDKADPGKEGVTYSGDFILAGRSSEIAGKSAKIRMLLELLLEQMGSNPEIEIRVRE